MERKEAITELTVHLEHWKRLQEQNLMPTDECENTIEALRMAIEALKEQEISSELQEYAYECGYEHFFHECQNCEHRRIENKAEPTHGRLIDADALMEKLEREGEMADDWKTAHEIANCVKYAPTVQADRPHGVWYNRDSDGTWATVDFAYCSECKQPIIHKHASPLWYFCPNCGADMRKEKK